MAAEREKLREERLEFEKERAEFNRSLSNNNNNNNSNSEIFPQPPPPPPPPPPPHQQQQQQQQYTPLNLSMSMASQPSHNPHPMMAPEFHQLQQILNEQSERMRLLQEQMAAQALQQTMEIQRWVQQFREASAIEASSKRSELVTTSVVSGVAGERRVKRASHN